VLTALDLANTVGCVEAVLTSFVVVRADKKVEVPEAVTELGEKLGDAWAETEDKPAVVVLGAFAFVSLFTISGLLKGLDSLPFAPTFFELVGIAVSTWFVYRYLLFKPDREELKKTIEEFKSKI